MMGAYSVITDVGETLRGLLNSITWEDIGLSETFKPEIRFESPKELEKEPGNFFISLFHYFYTSFWKIFIYETSRCSRQVQQVLSIRP